MGDFTGQELIQAAIYDDVDLLKCLLEGECRTLIDTRDQRGRTPVYTAVSNNSIKCLKVLLENGANPDLAADWQFHKMSPLHCAVYDMKTPMIRMLLAYGADYQTPDASGMSPLTLAHNYDQEMVDVFEEEIEKGKEGDRSKIKEFCQICIDEDTVKLEAFIKLYTGNLEKLVNSKVTEDEITALCWACKCGNDDLVKLLLRYGADPKVQASNELFPVHVACQTGWIECLKLLVQKCPDVVSLKTLLDKLPFHLAVEIQSLEMVKFLLEYKYPDSYMSTFKDEEAQVSYKFAFDLNAKTQLGFTALYIAADKRAKEIIEYLMSFSVKTDSVNRNKLSRQRETPGMMFNIRSNTQRETKEMAKQGYCPININKQCRNGFTALHAAVKNKFLDITNILLKNGADVNLLANENSEEKSALMMACEKGDIAILGKLLGCGADDLDKSVFRYATEKQPKMINMLLRYRTLKDTSNEYRINKYAMRQRYLNDAGEQDSFDGLSSLNVDFKKKFPSNSVHIKWQDLQHLTTVKEEWLRNVGIHHNKELQNSMNSQFAIFSITKIDVSGNKIGTQFPSILFSLPSLHCLIISKNHISHFEANKPTDFSCDFLEELILDTNQIEVLPGYLFTLPSLRRFSAAYNFLMDIPEEVWDLAALSCLNLSHNKLSSLPQPRISHQTRPMSRHHYPSSSSDISFNSDINSLVDTVFQTTKSESEVRHDAIWSTNLEVIENEFELGSFAYKQRGLQELNLSYNQLTEIPVWLCCSAPYMESLNLSNNNIKTAGKIYQYPMYLKTLDLSNNRLEDTTSWQDLEGGSSPCFSRVSRSTSSPRLLSHDQSSPKAGSFSNLSTVVCTHRQHTILERLDTLNLGENSTFRKVVLSKNVGRGLHGRSALGRSSTDSTSMASLSTAHEDIKRKLLFPNLTSLDLSHNRSLIAIPDDIGDHSGLKRLSLAFTGIRELPPQLGRLKTLFTLETDMCPIEGPIQDIIKGSARRTRDILGFLLSILEESEEYNCMNLMFVGIHDIGKTTLLQQIRKHGKAVKPLTHFTQRIDVGVSGNRLDGGTLSTVGIDINEIIIGERRRMGPVTFRTWDFGGQKEYYATHQYFLSPRSLYLVMWKLTDGEQGILTIWQWLVNIQARAPGAPVIIVGTHRDILSSRKTRRDFPESFEDEMIEKINNQFIFIEEPEKCGLPNVIGQINVSCKTGDHVKELVDMIYNKVFELKHPKRNKERLLQHKIPKKYLILKQIVQELSAEREREEKDPVLDKDSYMLKTMNKMLEISGTTLFRDVEDVEQATRFLHENGILFHYEDLALKDLYFLNPQWLCDQLARVVTVDQVNRFPQNGIMKAENLRVLFKRSAFQPENIEQYICGLLGKFEVALQFDRDRLIIPSLLPRESEMARCIQRKTDVKIALQKPVKEEDDHDVGLHLVLYSKRNRSGSQNSASSMWDTTSSPAGMGNLQFLQTTFTSNVRFSHCRLYVMTYFPSGFWPRLITRILADKSLYEVVMSLFPIPADILESCPSLRAEVPYWQPWQTGMQLVYYDAIIFRIKEILPGTVGFCDYLHSYMKCFIEDQWIDLDMANSVTMEMGFQADCIHFMFANYVDKNKLFAKSHLEKVTLDEKASARLLAKIAEHVDNLLQDWYPEIGESRFVQNCFGRYLITRIIPCGHCLHQRVMVDGRKDRSLSWQCVSRDLRYTGTYDIEEDDDDGYQPTRHRTAQESTLYCFLVERCILNFLNGHNEICPKHGSVSPTYTVTENGIAKVQYIAPDVVFNDIDDSVLLSGSDSLLLEKSIGKGAFGEVHAGKLLKVDSQPIDIAVKILFGPYKDASLSSKGQTHLHIENASVAYLTARQEISILQNIHHNHIVPLIGLSTRPLALVLALAPLGSLGNRLQQMYSDNRLLSVYTIKQIIIQVGEAVNYLHSISVIYRDLKADNVLLWQMSTVDRSEDNMEPVYVKIADYGISRAILPSGTKGFGGTPPFIAPEILQFAGKAQYTEKVDIFSFGMFIYELITCRKPLEDVTNPTLYICQNGRPSITRKERHYPSHFLDLMCVCWSHDPLQRPSSERLLQIARSPQFCHLADAVSMETNVGILAGCSVPVISRQEDHFEGEDDEINLTSTEIWISTTASNQNSRLEIYSFDKDLKCTTNKTLALSGCEIEGMVYTAGCVWCFDTKATVHIYNASNGNKERQLILDLKGHIKVLYSDVFSEDGEKCVLFIVKRHGQKKSDTVYLIKIKEDNPVCTPLLVEGKSVCATVLSYIPQRSLVEETKEENDANSRHTELWVGQSGGVISKLDLEFPHSAPNLLETFKKGNRTCTFLESATVAGCTSVWVYNYPGTSVFRMDPELNEVQETMNCSDIVPITESTVSGFSHVDAAHRYQVTVMKILDKYLYVGTTWGCIIVADAVTMLPFNVFRCHSSEDFYVRMLLPLHMDPSSQRPDVPGIISIGKGYRDLVRLLSKGPQPAETEREPDLESLQCISNKVQSYKRPIKNPTYILSWMAKNWEFY